MSGSLADRPYRELLDAFAAPLPVPGGGSAAALAAAAAAALVERCAAASASDGSDADGARAAVLRRELLALADEDALALEALVGAAGASPGDRAGAAAGASIPPGLLQTAAEEIARLAASLERDGAPRLRGEAACARMLGEAASQIAAAIVALNRALIGDDLAPPAALRRHEALIPLSHHHHRALVAARNARRAADGSPSERRAGAGAFLQFFDARAVAHFRDEEERIFPLLVRDRLEAPGELTRALIEHALLRARVEALRAALAACEVEREHLLELGQLLEAHVRLEERELFPLIQLRAGERLDELLDPAPAVDPGRAPDDPVVDLALPQRGRGPQWGMESAELNATLLAWSAGEGFAEHRNDERDVLLVVLEGTATVELDGRQHALAAHELVLLPRGSVRSLRAEADGVRYLSIHRRRAPLLPTSRSG